MSRLFCTFAAVMIAGVFHGGTGHALDKVRVALSVRNVVFLPFYYARDSKIFLVKIPRHHRRSSWTSGSSN